MFYSGWTGSELPTIPDNNYDAHHFASVDNNGNVIGYISYRISWITMSADNFGIISFGNHIEFARDVYKVICDLCGHPSDWDYEILECQKCGKKFEIQGQEWS